MTIISYGVAEELKMKRDIYTYIFQLITSDSISEVKKVMTKARFM